MNKKYRVVKIETDGSAIFIIEKKIRFLFFTWWSRYETHLSGDRSVTIYRFEFKKCIDAIEKCKELNMLPKKNHIEYVVYS